MSLEQTWLPHIVSMCAVTCQIHSNTCVLCFMFLQNGRYQAQMVLVWWVMSGMTSLRDRPALFPSFKAKFFDPMTWEFAILINIFSMDLEPFKKWPLFWLEMTFFLQETAPLKVKNKDVPNAYIIKNNGGTSSWFGSSPASSNSDNQSLLWNQLSSPYQYNVATTTAFDLK